MRAAFGGVSPRAGVGESLAAPLVAGPRTLFGPRGVCLGGAAGPLWIADTGHHRLLGWQDLEAVSDHPADWIIGQADAHGDTRNGGAAAGPSGLQMPAGLCRYGAGLAVADSWNHRVLLWHDSPGEQREPDLVLGQADFSQAQGNRGAAVPAADTLFWPSGVCVVGQRLLVADSGNRRVLIWNALPQGCGEPADAVLGQPHMQTRDGRGAEDAAAMVYPHGLAAWGDALVVADAGASRVMYWRDFPGRDGVACDVLLGQADQAGGQPNRGHPRPDGGSLAMPYAVAADGATLWVADTANSRLLGWPLAGLETGAQARRLHGQDSFGRAGDNRWGPVADDSLCWPYGLDAHAGLLAIADTGNNRVQVWATDHAR